MKRHLPNGPTVKKRISTPNNARKSMKNHEKNNAHQVHENMNNQSIALSETINEKMNKMNQSYNQSVNQSTSPVIKKLKEDLKLAKSAIRTCPICSKGSVYIL